MSDEPLFIKCPKCQGELKQSSVEGRHVIIVTLNCKRCSWSNQVKIKREKDYFDWMDEIEKMRREEENRRINTERKNIKNK